MKKIMNAISWTLFIIALIAGTVAVLSTIVGVVLLILCLYSGIFAKALAFCALIYFISVVVLLVIYLIACIYMYLEQRWCKK